MASKICQSVPVRCSDWRTCSLVMSEIPLVPLLVGAAVVSQRGALNVAEDGALQVAGPLGLVLLHPLDLHFLQPQLFQQGRLFTLFVKKHFTVIICQNYEK